MVLGQTWHLTTTTRRCITTHLTFHIAMNQISRSRKNLIISTTSTRLRQLYQKKPTTSRESFQEKSICISIFSHLFAVAAQQSLSWISRIRKEESNRNAKKILNFKKYDRGWKSRCACRNFISSEKISKTSQKYQNLHCKIKIKYIWNWNEK